MNTTPENVPRLRQPTMDMAQCNGRRMTINRVGSAKPVTNLKGRTIWALFRMMRLGSRWMQPQRDRKHQAGSSRSGLLGPSGDRIFPAAAPVV